MLRQMSDMPASKIGFEAVGKVDDDDFEDVVEPALRKELARGSKIGLLWRLRSRWVAVGPDEEITDEGITPVR